MLWSHTRFDIKTLTKLKVGYEQAKIVQSYQSLASVVRQALGGSKASETSTVPPGALKPQNEAELRAAFQKVLGHNG